MRQLFQFLVLCAASTTLRAQFPSPDATFTFQPSAVSQNNSSPTFIDDTGIEHQHFDYTDGLPTPDGDLFTVTSYMSSAPVTIRGYGRTGTRNLLFNTTREGIASISLKITGTAYLLVYCKLFSISGNIGVYSHVATLMAGSNLIAVTTASNGADVGTRVTLLRDLPGSNFFLGASLSRLHKYDVTTFTRVLTSQDLGGGSDYPMGLFYSASTDTVFAWWLGTSKMALFASSSFSGTLAQTTASGYPFVFAYQLYQYVLNNLLDTDLLELKTLTVGTSELGRRSLTNGGLARQAGPTFNAFGEGMLINLGTLQLLGLAPKASSPNTVSVAKGTLILIKKLDLLIYSTLTIPPTIDFS